MAVASTSRMRFCDYWWPIGELRPVYKVDSRTASAAMVNMNHENGARGTLFVYVDEGDYPWLARFSIGNLEKDTVPDDAITLVHIAREHLRTVLDCLHPDVAALDTIHFNSFRDEDEDPTIDIEIKAQYQATRFDPGLFQGLFKESMGARAELRLYQMATKTHMPSEYRYLSLFKILELTFARRGAWDYVALDKALAPAEDNLALIFPGLASRATIFRVRDMCAHAVLGKSKVRHGAMGLTFKQDRAVHQATDSLLSVGKHIINRVGKGRFGISERE